jgi:hypothetical protein
MAKESQRWLSTAIQAAGALGREEHTLLPLLSTLSQGKRIDPETIQQLSNWAKIAHKDTRSAINNVLLYQKAVATKETLLEETSNTRTNRELQRKFRETLKKSTPKELVALFEILEQHPSKDKIWVTTCSTVLVLFQKSAKDHPITASSYKSLRERTFASGRELEVTSSSERIPKVSITTPLASLPETPGPPPPLPKLNPIQLLPLEEGRLAEGAFFGPEGNGFEDKYKGPGLSPEERNGLISKKPEIIDGKPMESFEIESLKEE